MRYTVHAANSPATLWYVRDETTQRPVDHAGNEVVPATNGNLPEKADFLFFRRAAANARARELEAAAQRG